MAKLSSVIERMEIRKLSANGSVVFDWVVVVLGLWMIGGVHLDAWFHHEFKFESLFTLGHGVLYSGYVALSAVLLVTFIRNLLGGADWRDAMPSGYGLSLVGLAIFTVASLWSDPWLPTIGAEVGVVGLYSPARLLSAFGSALIVSGPLRAGWRRQGDAQRWVSLMPALLSLALLLSELSFFVFYPHPLSNTIIAVGHRPFTDGQTAAYLGAGISAILLQGALMMSVILLTVRRWRMPVGGLTLIITIAYGLTVSIHENFFLIPFEILAGLTTEILYWWLKPSLNRPIPFRWFAIGVPVAFFAFYFLALALTDGVWWTIHVWAGAILLSGIAGWLLSYAFVPPQITDELEA